MKINKYLLLSVFFSGNLWASDLETTQHVSHQGQTAQETHTFSDFVSRPSRHPVDPKETQTLFMQGFAAQRQSNFEEAKTFFYQAARYGNEGAMLSLARIALDHDHCFYDAFRWAVLASHVHHLGKSEIYKPSLTLLGQIFQKLINEKAKFSFNKDFQDNKTVQQTLYTCLKSDIRTLEVQILLKSGHFLFQKVTIPMYSPEDNQNHRRFLLSRSKSDLEPFLDYLKTSDFATPVNLTDIFCDLYTVRGLDPQEGLRRLAMSYILENKEKDAIKALRHGGDKDPHGTIGQQIFQDETQKGGDPWKAREFLETSKSDRSLFYLGTLYMNFGDGPVRFIKAHEYLSRSNILEAKLNLADIVRFGHHGETPDPEGARDMLEELRVQIESHTTDAIYQQMLPDLYNNLGDLYCHFQNKRKAKEYFRKSGTDQAMINLLGISEMDEAMEIYNANKQGASNGLKIAMMEKLGENPDHLRNPDMLNDIKTHVHQIDDELKNNPQNNQAYFNNIVSILCFKALFNLDNKHVLRQLRAELEEVIKTFNPTEYTAALMNFYIFSQKPEKAYLYLSKLMYSSLSNIKYHQEAIEKQFSNQEKMKKAIKEEKEKRKNRKKRKKEIQTRRYQEQVVVTPITMTQLEEAESKTIDITFAGQTIEQKFNDLMETEKSNLSNLMDYIRARPWETVGAGKPEVLKGTYKGFKGCISRRLDHKNRIVYQPRTGAIHIVDVGGHYDQPS